VVFLICLTFQVVHLSFTREWGFWFWVLGIGALAWGALE
jgi:hypothetical protein